MLFFLVVKDLKKTTTRLKKINLSIKNRYYINSKIAVSTIPASVK